MTVRYANTRSSGASKSSDPNPLASQPISDDLILNGTRNRFLGFKYSQAEHNSSKISICMKQTTTDDPELCLLPRLE